MKIAVKVLVIVGLILGATETSAGSSTIIGDIVIRSNDENGKLYCDGLICPSNTYSCEVIKHNDPDDFQQILRVRKCLSSDGKVLQDQVIKEPNRYQGNVNIHVSSGVSVGRELTPEEERQLQIYLEDVKKKIADEVEKNLSHLNEALRPLQDGTLAASIQSRFGADFGNNNFNEGIRPFLDGSFGENLRNQIQNQVKENLRNAFS